MFDLKELSFDVLTPEVIQEFRSFCTPLPSGHTRWDGEYNNRDRPIFRVGEHDFSADRVAFFIANHWISDDLIVCHKCDQPWCVDANCLELGTHQDNSDDMKERGRSRRGEEHPQSRFQEHEIVMIRASEEDYDELARQFDTSLRYIIAVKEYRTWKWMWTPIYIHPRHEEFIGMLNGKRVARDLTREDIIALVNYEGTAEDAVHELGVTKAQFKYVRENYDEKGRLNFRRNLNVVSYE